MGSGGPSQSPFTSRLGGALQPGWGPPIAPSPYGSELMNALAGILQIDPDKLRQFDALLASSSPLTAENGASRSDRVATSAPVPTPGYAPPGASPPTWFDESDFAPRLPDPSRYLAPPRGPLPTWETAAPAAATPPAASVPTWFDEGDLAPRLPDPSRYLAPPRGALPTWDTVAPSAAARPPPGDVTWGELLRPAPITPEPAPGFTPLPAMPRSRQPGITTCRPTWGPPQRQCRA
jgi:hypothetical protein